jgi:hypothetical protein
MRSKAVRHSSVGRNGKAHQCVPATHQLLHLLLLLLLQLHALQPLLLLQLLCWLVGYYVVFELHQACDCVLVQITPVLQAREKQVRQD